MMGPRSSLILLLAGLAFLYEAECQRTHQSYPQYSRNELDSDDGITVQVHPPNATRSRPTRPATYPPQTRIVYVAAYPTAAPPPYFNPNETQHHRRQPTYRQYRPVVELGTNRRVEQQGVSYFEAKQTEYDKSNSTGHRVRPTPWWHYYTTSSTTTTRPYPERLIEEDRARRERLNAQLRRQHQEEEEERLRREQMALLQRQRVQEEERRQKLQLEEEHRQRLVEANEERRQQLKDEEERRRSDAERRQAEYDERRRVYEEDLRRRQYEALRQQQEYVARTSYVSAPQSYSFDPYAYYRRYGVWPYSGK